MSGIAGLFNVPISDAELDTWASVHARHHVDINRLIYQITKLSLPEFVLEPIDRDNTNTWEEQHQIMHQNQNALLGIEGYDLSSVDFNDRDNLTAWIQLNAIEHREAEDLLRLSVPVVPVADVVSTFRSHAESGTATVSGYAFPAMDFGPEAANRILVACLSWWDNAPSPLTAAVIGGVAATTLVTNSVIGLSSAIVAALVPTGLNGTTAFSVGGTAIRGTAVVYSIENMAAVGASFVTSSSDTNPSVAFDVANGGTAIGIATNFSQYSPTGTWTGLDEDCDNATPVSGLGSLGRTTASKNFTSTTASFPITCSLSVPFGTLGATSSCFAYFAPGS